MSDATEPDYQPSACKRLRIDYLINLLDKITLSLDDLADEADELLVELGKRGQSTSFSIKLATA